MSRVVQLHRCCLLVLACQRQSLHGQLKPWQNMHPDQAALLWLIQTLNVAIIRAIVQLRADRVQVANDKVLSEHVPLATCGHMGNLCT